MLSDRIQRHIDRLLDEADEAIARRQWEDLRATSDILLNLDPDNSDAARYLALANKSLATGVVSDSSDILEPSPNQAPESEVDTSPRTGPNPRLLMNDPVEPPKSRRQIQLEGEEATAASIAACTAFIEATIQSDGREIWPLDQFQDRFGENILRESLKRLRKQKKISLVDSQFEGAPEPAIRRRD